MSEKRREIRAKQRATEILSRSHYDIINSDNEVFSIIALRRIEARLIRVVLDKASEVEKDIVRKIKNPMNCTKEIWIKKIDRQDFDVVEIK